MAFVKASEMSTESLERVVATTAALDFSAAPAELVEQLERIRSRAALMASEELSAR